MTYSTWCRLWTVLVFSFSFVWFVLTSASVPYPGASSDFLSSLCYPGFLPAEMQTPLDALGARAAVLLIDPKHLMLAMRLLSAALGALIAVAIFRASLACTHLAYAEDETVPELATKRTSQDFLALGTVTGFGAVLLSITSLPLWSLATRPQPHTFTVLLTMVLLAFSLGLRWRCAIDCACHRPPTFRRRLLMGLIFGFAAFLGTTAPTLLPVSVLAMTLSGAVIIRPETEGRSAYFIWIILGIIGGLVLSVISVASWHAVFSPEPDISPLRLWIGWMQTSVPQLQALLFTFEGAVPLVLFSLGAVLILECIPTAFLVLFRPLPGYFIIVALCAVILLRWPAAFWETQSEPSALAAVGILLIHMSAALLVGSWCRHLLDANAALPARKAYLRMILLFTVFILPLTGALAYLNRTDGAGLAANQVLKDRWAVYDAGLPEEASLWLNPPEDTFDIPLRRYLAGKPLVPATNTDDPMKQIQLGGKTLETCAETDPALSALLTVGGNAVIDYLTHSDIYHKFIVSGDNRPNDPKALTEAALAIESSNYGATSVGRHQAARLRDRAAREIILQTEAHAVHGTPAETAKGLIQALTLSPDNPAVLLNLLAVHDAGHPIDNNLRRRARDVIEISPWLRSPRPEQARAFEQKYGKIRSRTFLSAARLYNLCRGHRPAVSEALRRLYKEQHDTLSDRERLAVLVELPEAEATTLLHRNTPSEAELEFYLCAYPWTAPSLELYAKHQTLFENNDCISLMYSAMRPSARDRFIENKPLSFFHRDGRFAYAWLHVGTLLQQKKIDEAVAFISGFSVADLATRHPFLTERLRLRVLSDLKQDHPGRARTLLESWLRSNPLQYALWTALFELSDDDTVADNASDPVRECLRHFPYHPIASARFAARLRKSAGDAAADRYCEALKRAEAELFTH